MKQVLSVFFFFLLLLFSRFHCTEVMLKWKTVSFVLGKIVQRWKARCNQIMKSCNQIMKYIEYDCLV